MFLLLFIYLSPNQLWKLKGDFNLHLVSEDHWSCIAHLIAEDMLKSAVSPWAGTDNPLEPKFWCQQVGLITMVIFGKFTKNPFNLWLYTFFHDLINVYSRRSGADNPRGQNFDVNRNLLSLQSFATSFKQISLKSDFIQFFHDFIHVSTCSPEAGADNP